MNRIKIMKNFYKKWWFWLIIMIIFLMVLDANINDKFCKSSQIEEYYSKEYKQNVMGCPSVCYIGSCNGQTSCCSMGLKAYLKKE